MQAVKLDAAHLCWSCMRTGREARSTHHWAVLELGADVQALLCALRGCKLGPYPEEDQADDTQEGERHARQRLHRC